MIRRHLLAALSLVLVGACTPGKAPAPPPPSSPSPPSAPARSAPAKPQFTFPDLTQGDATSMAKLYSYDAAERSAVVEPIIFMTGDDFCKTYKIKSSDSRCSREWTTEDSHIKVTVPVARKPKLTTWDDGEGGVCIDSPTSGGQCPTTTSAFAGWLEENPEGFVKVTVKDGTITALAQLYTP